MDRYKLGLALGSELGILLDATDGELDGCELSMPLGVALGILLG